MNMNESDSTAPTSYGNAFRDECALRALEQFATKMFESQFIREARDAELTTEQYLAAYVWAVADAIVEAR